MRPRVAVTLALAALGLLLALAVAPAGAVAAPPTLWTKCVGGLEDISCSNARGVAAAPTKPGHVYVAGPANVRMVEFTAWGVFVKAWGWDVVASGPGDDTTAPEDEFEICVPANGDVCKSGTRGSGAGQLPYAVGVAVDSAGNVYVGQGEESRRVQKFDSEGHFLVMFGGDVNKTKVEEGASEAERNRCPIAPTDVCQDGSPGTGKGQFGARPVGDWVAVGLGDEVYVGDQERIQIFNPDGTYKEEIAVPGESVQSLATDPAGNLYLTFAVNSVVTKPDVRKLSPAGAPLCTAEVDEPRAVAADEDGNFYVVDGVKGPFGEEVEVRKFSSACAQIEDASFPFHDGYELSTGIATGQACLSKGTDLYVSDASNANAFVRAYGPAPDDPACPPPPKPPQILASYPVAVGSEEATLRAEINPLFWSDSRYHVQYATAACIEEGGWEAGCVKAHPAPPGSLLGGGIINAVLKATVVLDDLAADTGYRFRFVAESGGGGPVFGPERALATYPSEITLNAGCPNQAFRVGPGALLPDCRAYELVSPLDKNGSDIAAPADPNNSGYDVGLEQSAARVPEQGRGLTYTSKQAFGDAQSAPFVSQYLASRGAVGWSSHALFPPRETESFLVGIGTLYLNDFSEDLRYGWLMHEADPPLHPCAPAGYPGIYRRDNADDSYAPLTCEPLQAANVAEFQGESADSTHALFSTRDSLTPDALPANPNIPTTSWPSQLYEWVESLGGLRLVSVLPNGNPCPGNSSAGAAFATRNDGRWRLVGGAISTDGERIYWTCDGRLYLRSDGEGPSAPVSELVSSGIAQFWGAAEDGSRALFTIGDLATGKATLYRYDAEAGEAGAPLATQVRGLMGGSEDASHIYFVSGVDLDAGGPATTGAHNLYLYDDAEGEEGAFAFIAALSGDDAKASTPIGVPSPVNLAPIMHTARVGPDGRHAAFASNSRELAEAVAGYDNTDIASGEPDTEAYLYDADAEELHCASCNPGGSRPMGRNIEPYGTTEPFWVSARIATSAYGTHDQRALSENGSRLFFESYDALLPRDTNSAQDVYQWQAPGSGDCTLSSADYFPQNGGCLSLLSTGKSAGDSAFADASVEGSDVFIETFSSIHPADPGLRDIYDARIGGGFPPPPPASAPCLGDACQSAPAPPNDPTPASATFGGPGDPSAAEPRRRCARGKARRKGRCVAKRRGQRAAKHDRRAQR